MILTSCFCVGSTAAQNVGPWPATHSKTQHTLAPLTEHLAPQPPSPLLSGYSLFSRIFLASVPSSIRSSFVRTPIVRIPNKKMRVTHPLLCLSSALESTTAWDRDPQPGIETHSLGSRPTAWDRDPQPGIETHSLGSRPTAWDRDPQPGEPGRDTL